MSIAVVAAGLEAEEEGACFAGALLISTLPSAHNFRRIEVALQTPIEPRIVGIGDALLHAPDSDALRRALLQWMNGTDPTVQAMAVSVAARRRIDVRGHLPRVTPSSPTQLSIAVATACGRLRITGAVEQLSQMLRYDAVEVRCAAALALLSIVPVRIAAYARSTLDANVEFGGALARCLGITGDVSDANLLLNYLDRYPQDTSVVEALGILGVPKTVPRLISLLDSENEGVKLTAASALDLIAGLHPKERVPAPASVDEPTAQAEPIHEMERINCSQEFWREWWRAHVSLMYSMVRCRRGDSFTLGACIDELEDPQGAYPARVRAALEIAVHGSKDALEPDWFVDRQTTAISALWSWWATQTR
jgi:hypothetical protein